MVRECTWLLSSFLFLSRCFFSVAWWAIRTTLSFRGDFEFRKSEAKTKRTHSRLRSTNHSKECYVWCKSWCAQFMCIWKQHALTPFGRETFFLSSLLPSCHCCSGPDVGYIAHKHSLLFSMTNCFPYGHCSRPVTVFFARFFSSFAFFIWIHVFSSMSCTQSCICVWVSKCINKSISKSLLCFVSSECFSRSLCDCICRFLCNVFAAAFFVASFT